jgi:hypothetical protein
MGISNLRKNGLQSNQEVPTCLVGPGEIVSCSSEAANLYRCTQTCSPMKRFSYVNITKHCQTLSRHLFADLFLYFGLTRMDNGYWILGNEIKSMYNTSDSSPSERKPLTLIENDVFQTHTLRSFRSIT